MFRRLVLLFYHLKFSFVDWKYENRFSIFLDTCRTEVLNLRYEKKLAQIRKNTERIENELNKSSSQVSKSD